MPLLVLDAPEGPQRAVKLGETVILLGRSRAANVRLAHRTVSKRHARISPCDDGYRVEDLRSRNGTYVNDEGVNEAILEDGDVLRIGGVRFLFTAADRLEDASIGLSAGGPRTGRIVRSSGGLTLRRRRRPGFPGSTLRFVAAASVASALVCYLIWKPRTEPVEVAQRKPDVPASARRLLVPTEAAHPETVDQGPGATRARSLGRVQTAPATMTSSSGDPTGVRAWARSVVAGLLAREPSREEEDALVEARSALPEGVVGTLPLVHVVESGSRNRGVPVRMTPEEGDEVDLLFSRFLSRQPTGAERTAFRQPLDSDSDRRAARIALSSAHGPQGAERPAGDPRSGGCPCGVVIVHASEVDSTELLGRPDLYPATRRLARAGTLVLELTSVPQTLPAGLLEILCGDEMPDGCPPSPQLIPDIIGEISIGECWLVVQSATGWDQWVPHLISGSTDDRGFRLWTTDASSHPSLRRLVDVFGSPLPLGLDDWERVRDLREVLGSPVGEIELDVARALSGASLRSGTSSVVDFVEALRERPEPRLIVAVVAPSEDREARVARSPSRLADLDALLARLEPGEQSASWLAFVCPWGRSPSEGKPRRPGFLVAAGTPFVRGRVVAEPLPLIAVRDTLLRALGVPHARGHEGIEDLFRR